MKRHGIGVLVAGLAALTLTATHAPPSRADLLVQQSLEEPASYRMSLEGEATFSLAELEASLVLFFPPLTPPPRRPPTLPPTNPPDRPGTPLDPPEEPPIHHPEPASLVVSALGGSMLFFFGWWRRR